MPSWPRSIVERLRKLDPEARLLALYACWSRSEACAKALGTGHAARPKPFDLLPRRDGVLTVREDGPVRILDLAPAEEYAAALATPRADCRAVCLDEEYPGLPCHE